MYLVDTNVLSELRKPRTKANVDVVAWLDTIDTATLFLSPITLMELEIGILRIARRDPQQGNSLRRWFDENVTVVFADRILSIGSYIALRCAQLHVPNPCSERDAWIAASALVHGMTVVTRNTADFAASGVRLLNPWEPQG